MLPAGGVVRLERLGVATEVIEDEEDSRAAAALADRLIALKTQVVHAHMFRAEVVAALAAAAATWWRVVTTSKSRLRG